MPCTINCCPTVNCDDPYSILIQAIINLNTKLGSTLEEIEAEVPNVCADTVFDVPTALSNGVKRGIFGYGTATTYIIRGDMVQLNIRNKPYYRGIGCPGAFYVCH